MSSDKTTADVEKCRGNERQLRDALEGFAALDAPLSPEWTAESLADYVAGRSRAALAATGSTGEGCDNCATLRELAGELLQVWEYGSDEFQLTDVMSDLAAHLKETEAKEEKRDG